MVFFSSYYSLVSFFADVTPHYRGNGFYEAGFLFKAKQKYRGMFETQKSGNKTSSGEIGLDIRTHASPKEGQDQVSGGVSVLCWHGVGKLKKKKSLNVIRRLIPLFTAFCNFGLYKIIMCWP